MIIDADVHISPYKSKNRLQIDELIEKLDQNNIDRAITWLQPNYNREISKSNRYIYDSMKKYPNRILGFGWVDPNLGVENAIKETKKCIKEYGFYGVKLNGHENKFIIDDPEFSIPIIEEIARNNSILALHVGSDAIENTHPHRVGNIAKKFPNLKIFAVHMGGSKLPDLGLSMIEFASRFNNIHLIGSKIPAKRIIKAIEILGSTRISYGSDAPFSIMRVELAKYKALLEGRVSENELNNILGDNITNILNI